MSLARIFLFIQDVYFYGLGVGDLGGVGVAELEPIELSIMGTGNETDEAVNVIGFVVTLSAGFNKYIELSIYVVIAISLYFFSLYLFWASKYIILLIFIKYIQAI